MPSCLRHSAFSFVEVLFAVIILGVGFIMIAAVFPVAIRQTKSTVDETTGAILARGAANLIDQISYYDPSNPNMQYMPATAGAVVSFSPAAAATTNAAWQAIRGNVILSQDPRYAFIPFYRRNGVVATPSTWDPNAQVFVICVQAQAYSTFTSVTGANPPPYSDVLPKVSAPTNYCNLQPRQYAVDIEQGTGGGPSTVVFSTFAGAAVGPNPTPPAGLAEGAFIIISSDGLAGASAGMLNGRIYRIGARRPDLDKTATQIGYELAPGYDFSKDAGPDGIMGNGDDINALPAASAWVVGQSFSDAGNQGAAYDGPAMDVSIYTTYVAVKK
jgi:Tfp pilus assembly protein PilV